MPSRLQSRPEFALAHAGIDSLPPSAQIQSCLACPVQAQSASFAATMMKVRAALRVLLRFVDSIRCSAPLDLPNLIAALRWYRLFPPTISFRVPSYRRSGGAGESWPREGTRQA